MFTFIMMISMIFPDHFQMFLKLLSLPGEVSNLTNNTMIHYIIRKKKTKICQIVQINMLDFLNQLQ